jgi:transcriptional regulator with XRE-family HTH domain
MPVRSPRHEAFGWTIRALRKRRGMSQEALAAKCELDRTYISGIERGTRNPSLTNILKIADSLSVSASELFAAAQSRLDAADGNVVEPRRRRAGTPG